MESTDWYSSCLDDDWYGSNLDLTAEYLRCHMESDLYEKVNEEYTEQRNVLLSGHSKGTDPEEVLTLAQGHYQDLCVQGIWTGVTQKQGYVSRRKTTKKNVVAFLSELHCHNLRWSASSSPLPQTS